MKKNINSNLNDLLIFHGENLSLLKSFPSDVFNLIYIDPPYNTGKIRQKKTLSNTNVCKTPSDKSHLNSNNNNNIKDKNSKLRKGFKDNLYTSKVLATHSYQDDYEDYPAFLEPRLVEAKRILKSGGSIFVHLDYREVHYVKVLMDKIFSRGNFVNEIIWAYDYGARSRSKWPAKHDNILVYAKDIDNYKFNYQNMPRQRYMSPGLVSEEKKAIGKTYTDVWWHTIVATNSKEKTSYPTQKPIGILNNIINVHSDPGDLCLDFFAGSGSFGQACLNLDRKVVLVDNNLDAIKIMKKRLNPSKIHKKFSNKSFYNIKSQAMY